ncbi:HET-domain-containing protein, partial [Stipitochalara longipes BDJ]
MATTTADISFLTLYDHDDLRLPKGSRSIRVLYIKASSSIDDEEQIQSRLRVVDLDALPPFSALSYVWGVDAAHDHRFIKCGAFNILVTENCYSALLHLRRKLGDFSIWIDAICINQTDKGEKEQQIPLMGSIYSSAETVYVWLGESSPQSDRAMSYLTNTGYQECFSRPNWVLRILNFLRIRTLSRADYVTYEDVSNILESDWIRRLWTYQEILLASNPIVVCGDKHLQWSIFALGIDSLQYQLPHTETRDIFISSAKTWAVLYMLGHTQRYGLIDGILSRKAQDPKDKAFAMWAVLQRFFAETLPTPNYSLSIGQIYKQLTIYLVHATGSLDVL